MGIRYSCARFDVERNITHPQHNTSKTQTCGFDYLISLELGEATLQKKDRVENYLAARVKAGTMTLEDAQHGIATDCAQYIDAAKEYLT